MKKIIVAGFVIIVGLSALLFIPQKPKPVLTNQQIQKTITVFQKITLQQPGKKSDTIQIQSGKTALDLLTKTTKIETKGTGTNAFITEIDGRKADDSKKEFWAFYVNGKQAEVGAGSYILKPQDQIEWKIETY